MTAAYLVPAPESDLDPFDWIPEASRRGRATTVYAALRSLGRDGVAELVDRCCTLARRMADRLGAEEGIAILNEVMLNQVLVRFADDDERTRAVIADVQEDGTCWAGGTTWHGLAAHAHLRFELGHH
jgi:glutamate/tyrosine decarboxylase-like PLP-dependent enzyme